MIGLNVLEGFQVGSFLWKSFLKKCLKFPAFGGIVDKEDHGIPASLLSPEDGVHWEHLLSANPMARVVNGLDGLSLIAIVLELSFCLFFLGHDFNFEKNADYL